MTAGAGAAASSSKDQTQGREKKKGALAKLYLAAPLFVAFQV